MSHKLQTSILAGVVVIGGLLGSGATTAKAQGFGFPGYGSGYQPGIVGGGSFGSGYGRIPGYSYSPGFSYGPRQGYHPGYGVPGYGVPGYGGGYRPGSYYYSSRTTVTTIIYCSSCGSYHDRHAPCGGPRHGGGYFPGPFPW
ncbi:hypothetical protein BH23PLA1_BH23PLA1_08500 [soil metagenome]